VTCPPRGPAPAPALTEGLARQIVVTHHLAMSRHDLPAGTVTFLFTDVEGSTRLLHELGAERYAEALAEHRRTAGR
jgi:class 3 adenylate cyclase